jgi:hypothetical protein
LTLFNLVIKLVISNKIILCTVRGCREFEFKGSKLSLNLIIDQIAQLTELSVIVVDNYEKDNVNFKAVIAFKVFSSCFWRLKLMN